MFLCVPFILRPCKTYRDLMREGMSPVRYVSGTSFRLWIFHQFVQFVDHSFCETRPPVKSREHPSAHHYVPIGVQDTDKTTCLICHEEESLVVCIRARDFRSFDQLI